jgi:hypothetical protein
LNPSLADTSSQSVVEDRVGCPVCHVQVLQKNVNQHLDRCLAEQKGELRSKEAGPVSNMMRPMKQPVYHLLKDSELKKKLRENGLEVKGDYKSFSALGWANIRHFFLFE